jgi:hypothetical protein
MRRMAGTDLRLHEGNAGELDRDDDLSGGGDRIRQLRQNKLLW